MQSQYDKIIPCPCRSGKDYQLCCLPFHNGKNPERVLDLMRSRFTAYALCIPEYIIDTTHPASPQFCEDTRQWTRNIAGFSANYTFKDLVILESQQNSFFGRVTFFAQLHHNGEDASFTERSYFEKVKDKWLYKSGVVSKGHDLALIHKEELQLLPLAYYGNSILRRVADPIENNDDTIHELVKGMIETMDAYNGIGLSAPQIHHSIRLFIIRKPIKRENGRIELGEVKVFINPTISSSSAQIERESEGCLSIPKIYGEVERAKEIAIEYFDLNGNAIKENISGWEARIILHENDHLNGVLFIDHLPKKCKSKIKASLVSLRDRISSIIIE